MTDIAERAAALLNALPELGADERVADAVWWAGEMNLEPDTPLTRFVDAAPDLVRELLAEIQRLRDALKDPALLRQIVVMHKRPKLSGE